MLLVTVLVFLFMRQVMPVAGGLAGGITLSSFGVVGRLTGRIGSLAAQSAGKGGLWVGAHTLGGRRARAAAFQRAAPQERLLRRGRVGNR